ncbi:MAG: DUF4920 domain-containing protein [Gemmatimonadales bacterium]
MFVTLAALALLATSPDTVIRRGEALPDRAPVPLGSVLQDVQSYATRGEPIFISGVVERICTSKGCWMQVAPAPGEKGVRVTFKDYGFFIPLNSKGMKVRAVGTILTKHHDRDHVDHLEAEGAAMHRNADGSATEITLVASGIELTP